MTTRDAARIALDDAQLDAFRRDGYIVVRGVVPERRLAAVDVEIDRLLADSPPPPGTVAKHFYFLPPAELPAAHAALFSSPALAIAEQLTHPEPLHLILDHIQVALNIPPYPLRPGGPHIDGHARYRPDQTDPDSFTLLAGIFLSDERAEDSGNLWVWPGSHLVHQQLFRERGVRALMATQGHITLLDPPPRLDAPVQVHADRGDLLLAHFLLGHNTGANVGVATRRALYYRLGCGGHRQRWERTFLDVFTEYPRIATSG